MARDTEVYGWAARDSSGQLAPFEFKRRATGPHDVKLSVKFCGVCHTDYCVIYGEYGPFCKYPCVPGHEFVGVVETVGTKVTKFQVGDRVGCTVYVDSCRDCANCQRRLPQHCQKKFVATYNDIDYEGHPTYGGYSNLMVVDENYCVKIPENLPMDAAAPLLCAGASVWSPMKRYGMGKGGNNVGVVGLGGLGHVAVLFAKAMGMHVTVISTSPSKEKLARETLGADNFICSTDEDAMKAAKGSLDFIIDTISCLHPLDPYLHLLAAQGQLIILGGGTGQYSFSCGLLLVGGKTIGGSAIASIDELQEMFDFCSEKNIVCLIEKIPIDYINQAMERLHKNDVLFRFVIDVEGSMKPPALPN